VINLNEVRCVDNRAVTQDEIERMAVSIGNVGLLQPLILREIDLTAAGERFDVVGGRRRYRALMLLKRYELPDEDYKIIDGDPELVSFIENHERKDLAIDEEIDHLVDLSARYDAAELATILGRSERYVRIRLKLAGLIPVLKQDIGAGKKFPELKLGHYEVISGYPDSVQESLVKGFRLNCPGSVANFASMLERSYRHLLSTARFDRVECTTCPKRTGAEPWLFEDLKCTADDQCLDPECFNHRTALKIREELDEIKKNHPKILLIETEGGDLPKPLARLKLEHRYECELTPCQESKAAAFVVWGKSVGTFVRFDDRPSRSSEPADPLPPAERVRLRRNKLASLKFAQRLSDPEQMPPRPSAETLLRLASLLEVRTEWGRPVSLTEFDTVNQEEALDNIWKCFLKSFHRHATWAKSLTLATQETGVDRVAASICGWNFEEFVTEAATEIPDAAITEGESEE
jgi:hypothetical protein